MTLKFFRFFVLLAALAAVFIETPAQTTSARDLFERGVKLLGENRFTEALDAFRQSAILEPREPTTHANIGIALISLNRLEESIAAFREAARLAPQEAAFRIGLCRGLSLAGNHGEAIEQCEESVRLGEKPETYIALITALKAAKRHADAAQRTQTALEKFADDRTLLTIAADAAVAAGDFQRAAESYETLARLAPQNAFYQAALAENYLRLERDAEAIAAARKAIEIEPQHPLAHYVLGRVYFELGQHTEAAASLRRAVELDARLAEAFYFLGVAEKRRRKIDRALPALREAARLSPGNFDYQRELGNLLNEERRFEEAAEFLRRAERLSPKDFETKAALAYALVGAARFDEGIEQLMQADRLRPGHPTIQMFLNVARARREGAGQIETMKQIAAGDPKDAGVRDSLASMLVYLNRTAEAESVIAELIPLLPRDNKSMNAIGVLYSEMGKTEKAVEFYRRAIEIEPHHVIYMSLAGSLEKIGRTAEAFDAYRKALEIKPDSAPVLKRYADLLRDEGKRQEAIEIYKRTIEAEPTNSPALFNLGALHIKIGNLDAAKQYYERLRAVDPQAAKTLARYLRASN